MKSISSHHQHFLHEYDATWLLFDWQLWVCFQFKGESVFLIQRLHTVAAVKTVVTSSAINTIQALFLNLWILIWVNKLKRIVTCIGYQTKHLAWRKSSYILNRNNLHTLGVCMESTAVGSAIGHTETSSYGWQHFYTRATHFSCFLYKIAKPSKSWNEKTRRVEGWNNLDLYTGFSAWGQLVFTCEQRHLDWTSL